VIFLLSYNPTSWLLKLMYYMDLNKGVIFIDNLVASISRPD
jgi:hypothetical protein